MPTLGVVVVSLPGMMHLDRCLESVQWAEAVFLLHLGAEAPSIGTDSYPSLVLRKLPSLREIGESCKDLGTDWILHLWGEEVVETELREELRVVCRKELAEEPLAYRVAIRSRILGRWAEGSLLGPSPALRLSRGIREIASGWWDSSRIGLGQYPAMERGWIGDYSAAALENGVRRIEAISGLWADDIGARGAALSVTSCVLRPLAIFIRTLVRNGIFAGGISGLTLSALAAYAALLTGAKVWEARNVRGSGSGANPGASG